MLRKLAVILAVCALPIGYSSAADSTAYTTYTEIGAVLTAASISYKSSANVQVYYKNDGVTPKSQLYTIGSKNTSGDAIYATSNMSGNIYKRITGTNLKAGNPLSGLTGLLPTNAGESIGWGADWTVL